MSSGILPYEVVYCTSQDPTCPLVNLLGWDPETPDTAAGASSSGWQSATNGKAPQTLVLRFPGMAWLHQLRILSHEAKIASSVEVRIFKLKRSDCDAVNGGETDAPSFRTARFMKLGTVDFNRNEHSRYSAKERKTVHLKTDAYFVKLLFNAPYDNPMNPLKQIGIYSIECVGYVVTPLKRHAEPILGGFGAARPVTARQTPGPAGLPTAANGGGRAARSSSGETPAAASRHATAAPFIDGDDQFGSSSELQSFRSVRIIEFEEFFLRRSEELLSLKDQAIAVEDFETATECRDRLTQLNALSLSVYRLEQEKVQRIIEEDFEQATTARDTMNELVEQAFVTARLPDPVSPRPAGSHANDMGELSSSAPIAGRPRVNLTTGAAGRAGVEMESLASDADEIHHELSAIDLTTSSTGSGALPHEQSSPRSRAVADNAAGAVDNVPVGGARASGALGDSVNDMVVSRVETGEVVLSLDSASTAGCEQLISAEILAATGEEENGTVVMPNANVDVRLLTPCLGQFPTACLISRRFKLREAALTVLTEAMFDHYRESAADVEDAVLRFLDHNGYGLQDSIPNVVFAACTFVRLTLFDECQVLSTVTPSLTALLPRLLTRAADPLPRVRDEALSTISLYTNTNAAPVAPFLSAVLADPMDKDRRKVPATNPRAQLARLSALKALLSSGRATQGLDGMTTSVIRKLLLPAVNHPNFDVRDLGTTTFHALLENQGITLRESDLAKINNPAIREAVVTGKRQRKH